MHLNWILVPAPNSLPNPSSDPTSRHVSCVHFSQPSTQPHPAAMSFVNYIIPRLPPPSLRPHVQVHPITVLSQPPYLPPSTRQTATVPPPRPSPTPCHELPTVPFSLSPPLLSPTLVPNCPRTFSSLHRHHKQQPQGGMAFDRDRHSHHRPCLVATLVFR